MIIDNNETEKRAMKEFHLGNRKEGLKIQEEFASAFRTEYAHKDHCSCTKACRFALMPFLPARLKVSTASGVSNRSPGTSVHAKPSG